MYVAKFQVWIFSRKKRLNSLIVWLVAFWYLFLSRLIILLRRSIKFIQPYSPSYKHSFTLVPQFSEYKSIMTAMLVILKSKRWSSLQLWLNALINTSVIDLTTYSLEWHFYNQPPSDNPISWIDPTLSSSFFNLMSLRLRHKYKSHVFFHVESAPGLLPYSTRTAHNLVVVVVFG